MRIAYKLLLVLIRGNEIGNIGMIELVKIIGNYQLTSL